MQDLALMKRDSFVFSSAVCCCFNWGDVFEMNSSKILNNHITHVCNCMSAYKPKRPYYPGNHSSPTAVRESSFAQKWKKTTNKWILRRSQGACRQISSELVFVWPYHCDCWMSEWRTLKRRAPLFIQIHRSNQKMEYWTFSTQKRHRDQSQKDKYKCVNRRPLQESKVADCLH